MVTKLDKLRLKFLDLFHLLSQEFLILKEEFSVCIVLSLDLAQMVKP
jgi:hypothetical protein